MTRGDVILAEVGGIVALGFTAIALAGTGAVVPTLFADGAFALGCLIAAGRPRREASPVVVAKAARMPQVWRAVDMPRRPAP